LDYDLAAAVARTQASALIPKNYRGVGELKLRDSFVLGANTKLLIVEDQSKILWSIPARFEQGHLRRAHVGDGASEDLITALVEQKSFNNFSFQNFAARHVRGEKEISADQTNESVVVGDQVVVKWQTKLQKNQAAPAKLIALHDQSFEATPPLWGLASWRDPRTPSDRYLLASAISFVKDGQDGWEWCVGDLIDYLANKKSLLDAAHPLEVLGTITGNFHANLADGSSCDDWSSKYWLAIAQREFRDALSEVQNEAGTRLKDLSFGIYDQIQQISKIETTPVTRIHGDLHVGQFLRASDAPTSDQASYFIIDFDGNPLDNGLDTDLPAATDVASMLQSIDHVGRIVLRKNEGTSAKMVTTWIRASQQKFMAGYSLALQQRGFQHLLDERLLRPFRIRQELREYLYAARHLPRWGYIPDSAMPALLKEES